MKIEDGKIIEGKLIGEFSLGMDYYEVITLLGNDYLQQNLEECKIVQVENAKFWFDSLNKLYQISVFGDFKGKFKNEIGINSTLSQVKEKIGEYEDESDIYVLKAYKGVGFELKDVDDWEELTAPIEFISVFN